MSHNMMMLQQDWTICGTSSLFPVRFHWRKMRKWFKMVLSTDWDRDKGVNITSRITWNSARVKRVQSQNAGVCLSLLTKATWHIHEFRIRGLRLSLMLEHMSIAAKSFHHYCHLPHQLSVFPLFGQVVLAFEKIGLFSLLSFFAWNVNGSFEVRIFDLRPSEFLSHKRFSCEWITWWQWPLSTSPLQRWTEIDDQMNDPKRFSLLVPLPWVSSLSRWVFGGVRVVFVEGSIQLVNHLLLMSLAFRKAPRFQLLSERVTIWSLWSNSKKFSLVLIRE